ncbi:MAG TPA: CxxC-x17-CxxC domain-containing protein [Candidatus Paceibacterota bacterium]|nr:CxxC-x17-CxxC domain-containing protein [Candidatus Paceibacterota bacterium]
MKDFKKSGSFGKKNFGGRPSFGARRAPGFGAHVSTSSSAESHKTNCDECHAPCEVPFIPNGKKPVYCRNCYKGKETTTSFAGQPFSAPADFTAHDGATDLKKQFSILNTKLDRLISAIEAQTRALSSTGE